MKVLKLRLDDESQLERFIEWAFWLGLRFTYGRLLLTVWKCGGKTNDNH